VLPAFCCPFWRFDRVALFVLELPVVQCTLSRGVWDVYSLLMTLTIVLTTLMEDACMAWRFEDAA
jgi:hypothetical protein